MLLVLFADSTSGYNLTVLSNWAFSLAKIIWAFFFFAEHIIWASMNVVIFIFIYNVV